MNQYGMNRRQAGSNAKPAVRAQIGRACAQTVRSLRLKAGLSQERLALGAGINRAYVAGLERGLHTPTLYTMCRLLPGLHVTFIEFCRTFERILSETTHSPLPIGRCRRRFCLAEGAEVRQSGAC